MGSMAVIQAVSMVFGGIFLAAKPAVPPLPLVSRPQVEAAGLTVYWDRGVVLQKDEQVELIKRLDENLYVITTCGRVITLDSATGVQRWTVTIADPNIRILGPTHSPDMVFFVTILGIQGLDRQTGESRIRWKGDFTPTGPVASDGQMLFGGDADSRVTAIRLRHMDIIWEFGTEGLVTSTPILLGPNVFVVSEGGRIYGAAKKDKTRLWPEQQVPPVKAAPAAYGSNLYVPTLHQSLYCFDLVNGHLRWQTRLPAPLYLPPQATSHGVYQPIAQFGVFSIDPADGHVRWTLAEGVDLLAEHEDLVWMMSTRCSLVGCDRKDGQVRKEVPCGAQLWASNDVDDAIFVASAAGQLACIRPAGAGFLRYKTMMESAARMGTSQPATAPATQDSSRAAKARPARDYLRGGEEIPPVAGSNRAPASQPQ